MLLKEEVRAKNVVTEHNLDVLSVLNHAADHAETLGLNQAQIKTRRDELREGIFRVLWDDDDRRWRDDLGGALTSEGVDAEKRSDIEAALAQGDWGRVSTGGLIVTSTDLQALIKGRLSRDGVLGLIQSGSSAQKVLLKGSGGSFHFLRRSVHFLYLATRAVVSSRSDHGPDSRPG